MSEIVSKPESSGINHRRRYERWKARVAPKTQALASLVDSQLVPQFLSAGYEWVDFVLRRRDWPVNANEIELEKAGPNYIDCIDFRFAKYDLPRFQLGFSRRKIEQPNEFIRSANLVRDSSQHYHFWGKPAWVPTNLWPESNCLKTIEQVSPLIDQVLEFLDRDIRGPNVSRPS